MREVCIRAHRPAPLLQIFYQVGYDVEDNLDRATGEDLPTRYLIWFCVLQENVVVMGRGPSFLFRSRMLGHERHQITQRISVAGYKG